MPLAKTAQAAYKVHNIITLLHDGERDTERETETQIRGKREKGERQRGETREREEERGRRGRERERDTERDRQTERHTHRQIEKMARHARKKYLQAMGRRSDFKQSAESHIIFSD